MRVSKTFNWENLLGEELTIDATGIFSSYTYGDDYDGNRGIERCEIEDVVIDEVYGGDLDNEEELISYLMSCDWD